MAHHWHRRGIGSTQHGQIISVDMMLGAPYGHVAINKVSQMAHPTGSLLTAILIEALAPRPRLPEVYPGYLAKLVRDALRHHGDPEGVITSIDDIIRIGDGKDLIVATDFNGTRYRITVEVEAARVVLSSDPNPDELEDDIQHGGDEAGGR